MEFEVFSAISEAQKKDELFECDKQDYEFQHVSIHKKPRKNKKKFDLDSMNVDGENQQEKPVDAQNQAPSGSPAQGDNQTDPGTQQAPKQGGGGDGGPCELSDEVLSDSDDSEDAGGKPPVLSKQDYKVAAQEKPMDTFKSMYSEFKEFIPDSMKPKEDRSDGKEGEQKPKNVSFMNKARGFFGL